MEKSSVLLQYNFISNILKSTVLRCYSSHTHSGDFFVFLLTDLVADLQDFLAAGSPSLDFDITAAVSALSAAWRNPSAHCKTEEGETETLKKKNLQKQTEQKETWRGIVPQLDFLFQRCMPASCRPLRLAAFLTIQHFHTQQKQIAGSWTASREILQPLLPT